MVYRLMSATRWLGGRRGPVPHLLLMVGVRMSCRGVVVGMMMSTRMVVGMLRVLLVGRRMSLAVRLGGRRHGTTSSGRVVVRRRGRSWVGVRRMGLGVGVVATI